MQQGVGDTSTGPCAGLRVLDFSTVVSGPMCSMILGDLGADVIKVETLRGDATRLMGPPFREGGLTPIFLHFNRNKRSIALDLKHADGRAAAQRLASDADVVVLNFRPGVAARLGIDYESLAAVNPKVVHVSISGFGPDGPYAALPAYDGIIQGLTGHMPVQGQQGAPALIRSLAADKASALTATYATLAALLARERHGGRGQKVEIPMLDAYAAFILPDAMLPMTFLDEDHRGMDLSAVHRAWPTADGHVVVMFVEDGQFDALCRVLEREELLTDPRFNTALARLINFTELIPLLEEALRRFPTATLVQRARALGAPLAPVHSVAEFFADAQVEHNQTVFETQHPDVGNVRYLRNPARMDETPPSLRRHAPRLGEHGDEILRQAGYTAEEIAALRRSGILI